MRKFTLFVLLVVAGSSVVSAQSDFGRTRSRMLHQLFSQSQPELRTSIVDLAGGKPDSSIRRTQDGKIELKTTYQVASDKETWAYYRIDDASGSYVPSYKYEYYFDANGNDTLFIDSEWMDGNWKPYDKTRYVYENGVLTYEYFYRASQVHIDRAYKIEVIMNTGTPATVASEIYYEDENEDGVWVRSKKKEYTYNEEGKVLSELRFDWNTDSEEWVSRSRGSFEYDDPNGKCTLFYGEKWDETSQSWNVFDTKRIFEYDDQGRISTVTYYKSNTETNTWESQWDTQETFYYADSNLGIRRVEVANATIWSYGKEITIESESELMAVNIYNLSGSLLYTQRVGGTYARINGDRLYSGIFIVNVRMANGQSKAAKIIVQ